jgi:hypothetical protein
MLESVGEMSAGLQNGLDEVQDVPGFSDAMDRNPAAMAIANRALAMATNQRANRGNVGNDRGPDDDVPEFVDDASVTGPGNAFLEDASTQKRLAAQLMPSPETRQDRMKAAAGNALQMLMSNPEMLGQVSKFINARSSFQPLMNNVMPQNNQMRGADLIPPPM